MHAKSGTKQGGIQEGVRVFITTPSHETKASRRRPVLVDNGETVTHTHTHTERERGRGKRKSCEDHTSMTANEQTKGENSLSIFKIYHKEHKKGRNIILKFDLPIDMRERERRAYNKGCWSNVSVIG